jgi:hypothetical protein
MRSRTALFFIGLAMLASGEASGQVDPVAPGTRLRVWTENAPQQRPRFDRTTGTLSSLTDETLFLTVGKEGQLWQISRPSIARVETPERRSRGQAAVRAGGTGLLIGLMTGAAIGFLSGDDDDYLAFSAKDKALIFGVVLAVPSAIVGAVFGASRPGERWHQVPLPVAP